MIIIITTFAHGFLYPPPPPMEVCSGMSVLISALHMTRLIPCLPLPPPEKFLIDSEWPETARNRRKKNCHLVTPTRKKLRKISIITENFFFEIFNFLDVSDDSEQLSKNFWKKILKIFLSFFRGGVTKGQKIFFRFLAELGHSESILIFFPIFCKIDPIGGGTQNPRLRFCPFMID